MNVKLTPDLEEFMQELVASDGYTSGSEVVREALRLLRAFKKSFDPLLLMSNLDTNGVATNGGVDTQSANLDTQSARFNLAQFLRSSKTTPKPQNQDQSPNLNQSQKQTNYLALRAAKNPNSENPNSDETAKGSDAPDEPPITSVFELGVLALCDQGMKPQAARAYIGALRRDWPEQTVDEAILAGIAAQPEKFAGYLRAVLKDKQRKHSQSKYTPQQITAYIKEITAAAFKARGIEEIYARVFVEKGLEWWDEETFLKVIEAGIKKGEEDLQTWVAQALEDKPRRPDWDRKLKPGYYGVA